MRIIFLDVDGVLNNDYTEDKYNNFTGIDPILLDRLKILYDTSNEEEETRIVVSSSWRLEKIRKHEIADGCYEYLLSRLNEYGMEVVGMTPDIFVWCRGSEILEWMIVNKEIYNVSTFVILDDETFNISDVGYQYYLVQTNYEVGLTDSDVEYALSILRG